MIIYMTAYFYTDDSLMALTQPERLQRAFDFLTGLFDWVSLQTNTAKTFGMVYHPCHPPGGGGVVGGSLRMTGDREMTNVSGTLSDAGEIPIVRSVSDSGLAPNTSSDPEWCEEGKPGGGTPPPHPPGRPRLIESPSQDTYRSSSAR